MGIPTYLNRKPGKRGEELAKAHTEELAAKTASELILLRNTRHYEMNVVMFIDEN